MYLIALFGILFLSAIEWVMEYREWGEVPDWEVSDYVKIVVYACIPYVNVIYLILSGTGFLVNIFWRVFDEG